jgi:hypothetical protein
MNEEEGIDLTPYECGRNGCRGWKDEPACSAYTPCRSLGCVLSAGTTEIECTNCWHQAQCHELTA